jgi:hypothetical protein
VRNAQAQETSVGITRGARTLKGRLPAVSDGADSIAAWKAATTTMKDTMHKGTFVPFQTALEKGLITNGSSLEQFTAEASKLLSRRRLYRADGAAVRDASAGDAASAPFLALMQKVVQHMIDVSQLGLQDVANYEMYLFFTSCLLGTATLRDQTYRLNVLDDVYMDEAGRICESIFAPLQLKVKASTSESGHLLSADGKAREATLPWLIMVCAVRPMRALLHDSTPSKLIWGMSGTDNNLVSKSAWSNRIQSISKLHLGSPRTGSCIHFQRQCCRKSKHDVHCYPRTMLPFMAGHGVYRLMGITCKIYDVRRQYGGITEPGARSALLCHAHRCNTSLETMLVSVVSDIQSSPYLLSAIIANYEACLCASLLYQVSSLLLKHENISEHSSELAYLHCNRLHTGCVQQFE